MKSVMHFSCDTVCRARRDNLNWITFLLSSMLKAIFWFSIYQVMSRLSRLDHVPSHFNSKGNSVTHFFLLIKYHI